MEIIEIPLLPLRDVVVFPHMVMPLFVGRKESINALDSAMEDNKHIFLLAQNDGSVNKPGKKDLYQIGVVATILQLLRLPDGTVKALVEGVRRARMVKLAKRADHQVVKIEIIETEDANITNVSSEVTALMRSVMKQFESYIKRRNKIPAEVLMTLNNIEDPCRFCDSVASHLSCKVPARQNLLEKIIVKDRLSMLHELLSVEVELADVEKNLQTRVKQQVDLNQKEYYLREKLKAVQKELGETEGSTYDEMGQLEKKIEDAGMPKEVKQKADNEISKLKAMPSMSAEATVCRNYLDWLTDVPWKNKSKVNVDLTTAQEILDADHYGLEKVKERIIEYLAVQKRVKKLKGPILCLVGPPGVGKTSLGQSIANATGRKFARVALGGVRDEAEIRGHRRTYVGSMPGKVLQKMAKVKVRNPLFMLDEVDKMAMDFRGDPASALLEVLDPEQNFCFNDHFLEVDYDLSDVMFIATANSMNIPPALLDRMEVIRLAGYTENEKLQIALRYLLPRQLEANGLTSNEMSVTEDALMSIIRYYTREAGVRNLEREIAKIARKVVRTLLTQPDTEKKTSAKSKSAVKKTNVKKAKIKTTNKSKTKLLKIDEADLEEYLGVRRFRYGLAEEDNQVGQVTGLAWTEVGGELLTMEAQVMSGKGAAIFTGSLGDVMQESIKAAMTVVRTRGNYFGAKKDYFQKHDFHVHVPEGATPKDGPSAGIGMCTALVSAITGIPVKASVAMTGEITLRGEVLPIGGLKEKLLAASRGGITTVLIPQENERDLKEIPEDITKHLDIHPVKWIDQVLDLALQSPLKIGTVSETPGTMRPARKRRATTRKPSQPPRSTH